MLRIGAWIASAVMAYGATGALSLLVVSYAASALTPHSDEREVILGIATLAWSLLACGSVLALGRALLGRTASPSAVGGWLITGGVLAAVAVTFVTVADVRAAIGYYEPDLVGLRFFVAPAVVAITVASLGAEIGRGIAARAWHAIVGLCAVAALAASTISIFTPTIATQSSSTVVLLAASSYAIAALAWSGSALRADIRRAAQRRKGS